MNIAVFCSANNNIAPDYFRAAEELGTMDWKEPDIRLVLWWSQQVDLMECIGKAVHEAGGRTIGVIPRILEEGRRVSDYVDVEIPCEDLTDRKAIIMERSDEFYALPGGIGTIDEIFTVAASASIGYHHKKVTLVNVQGFWDSLIALLNDQQEKGMMRGRLHDYIEIKNIDDF